MVSFADIPCAFFECNFDCVKIIFASYGGCLPFYNPFYTLTGSWVKLDGSFRNGNGAQHSPVISEDDAMEDLLAEAVEEQSKQGSRYVADGAGVMNWAVVRLALFPF